MSNLSDFIKYKSQSIADELVDINTKQVLTESVSGFGMKARVIDFTEHIKAALFPVLYERNLTTPDHLSAIVVNRINSALMELTSILEDIYINSGISEDKDNARNKSMEVAGKLMDSLPTIRRKLSLDVKAAYDGDPAAHNYEEILLSYPSMEAITVYRVAHELYELDVPVVPRIMTEYAHQNTGIDINPGAKIGDSFFIDHGTGVVIGETTVIGNNVKIYQGVTLGAKSFELDQDGNPVKGIKRHPNIEDNVIIYSGATILGGDVTIGENSIIGGNVWLTTSVPKNTTVYNSTPKPAMKTKE